MPAARHRRLLRTAALLAGILVAATAWGERGRERAAERGRTPACADRVDNDGDGYADYPDDPGCRGPRDRRERTRRVGCCEVADAHRTRSCLERASRRECRAIDRAGERASFHADLQCEDAGCRVTPTTLLLGLDGGDWRILEPLMEAGHLPALRALVEGGTRAALDCRPSLPNFSCFCPPVWTTIATGTAAASHGIIGLPDRIASRRHSYDRRDPALWTYFGEAGLTTTVVSYRGSWPPEPDQTFNFTELGLDYAAFLNFVPGGVAGPFEPDLDQPLFDPASRTRPADLFEQLDLLPFTSEARPAFPYMARDRVAMEALSRLVEHFGQTDLTLLILHSPDKSEHVTWDSVQAASGEPIDETALLEIAESWTGPVYGHGVENLGTVASQYIEIDRWLGRFLERHPYDYVMIVSDHGMERNLRSSGLPGHHMLPHVSEKAVQTLYSLTGPGVRRGGEIGERIDGELQPSGSILDVVPTLLHLYGLEVPSELPGRVTLEFFDDEHREANPVRHR